jgi:hypothetical protein
MLDIPRRQVVQASVRTILLTPQGALTPRTEAGTLPDGHTVALRRHKGNADGMRAWFIGALATILGMSSQLLAPATASAVVSPRPSSHGFATTLPISHNDRMTPKQYTALKASLDANRSLKRSVSVVGGTRIFAYTGGDGVSASLQFPIELGTDSAPTQLRRSARAAAASYSSVST